ncbi:hypothetical protein F4777DRAFT_110084 [Nemania sp. FL0916]|nr:hypothetical protein F4777DRAFT_110084 [Nemania sp. FL0916]
MEQALFFLYLSISVDCFLSIGHSTRLDRYVTFSSQRKRCQTTIKKIHLVPCHHTTTMLLPLYTALRCAVRRRPSCMIRRQFYRAFLEDIHTRA